MGIFFSHYRDFALRASARKGSNFGVIDKGRKNMFNMLNTFSTEHAMPHFSIEYSGNLEPDLDVSALCETLRQAAVETELFPLAGIRVRAYRADHYAIADGNPDHSFIDVNIRLRAGRPQARREQALQLIFERLKTALAPLIDSKPIALSLEMRDIDPALSLKLNRIRETLAETHDNV